MKVKLLVQVQIFSIGSRQDGFIERVAGIAGEYPEHGEMSGIRAENFVVDDHQRLTASASQTGQAIAKKMHQ